MAETIIRIEDLSVTEGQGAGSCLREGYRVVTTEQAIDLLIDADSKCCERFGYLWTNERPADFIGAVLLDVRTDGESLDGERAIDEDYCDPNPEDRMAMFVDLVTDRGVLQFVAYNEQNGCYCHMASVRSRQLDDDAYL